jgi:hypothetical protein
MKVLIDVGEDVAGYAIAGLMQHQEKRHREIAERAATRLREAGR